MEKPGPQSGPVGPQLGPAGTKSGPVGPQSGPAGSKSGTAGTKSGTGLAGSSFPFYIALSISSIIVVLQIAIQYVIILMKGKKKVVKRRTKL